VQGRYPIRAVAKITGLGLDTLRAWERRYRAVIPERTERGREYGPDQIERLLRLSQLTRNGHSIGRIASLSDSELITLLAGEPVRLETKVRPASDLVAPVLAAIERYDAAQAGDELSRLAAVLSPRDLVYQVALPLMRETGVRWHSGTLAVAQEHLITQILRNLLGGMMRLFRPMPATPVPKRMVLATPAGESHEFGILVAAMLASLAGIEPVYLGTNLPAREIAEAAERTSARVIALSVTFQPETLVREVRTIAETMPKETELWLGGSCGHDLDLAGVRRTIVRLKDLPAFENECLRWSN
jgi:methanogenic corrinoid protein MtbC1